MIDYSPKLNFRQWARERDKVHKAFSHSHRKLPPPLRVSPASIPPTMTTLPGANGLILEDQPGDCIPTALAALFRGLFTEEIHVSPAYICLETCTDPCISHDRSSASRLGRRSPRSSPSRRTNIGLAIARSQAYSTAARLTFVCGML